MPYTVLIIEDEATLARNMKTYLQRQGYEVVAVRTGEEGLAQVSESRPDMVLLDYHLPKMNGIEFLEQLRKLGRQIKTIMITGQGNSDVAGQAIIAGACRYLSKPLALSDLKIVVEQALRSPA